VLLDIDAFLDFLASAEKAVGFAAAPGTPLGERLARFGCGKAECDFASDLMESLASACVGKPLPDRIEKLAAAALAEAEGAEETADRLLAAIVDAHKRRV
jgi:hypothetical protein